MAVGSSVFHLRAWRAWTPGRETAAAWCAWATGTRSDEISDAIPGKPVPMLLRRRLTPLGQQALRAAWALPETATARLVFASRHGELNRTISILKGMTSGEGVSPADFTLSVHHALAGLLSIACGNRQGHTAIAAGTESFGFGMVEAAACLAERPELPVVLVYYDEGMPSPYDAFAESREDTTAVALSLAASGPGEPFSLAVTHTPNGNVASPNLAWEFLRFALSGEPQAAVEGERYRWQWERHVPAA